MALIKHCDKCKAKISIREMPNGKWLPFEFQSDQIHKCKKKSEKQPKSKSFGHKQTKQEKIIFAINNSTDVSFEYNNKIEGRVVRLLTPTRFDNGMVTGFCHYRNAIRTFDLDKMYYIEVVEKLNKEFGNRVVLPSIKVNDFTIASKTEETSNSNDITNLPNLSSKDNNSSKKAESNKSMFFVFFLVLLILYLLLNNN